MNNEAYYRERNDRVLRYPGARRLDGDGWITLTADPVYVATYPGQVAAIVAGNLLARLTPHVALDVPDVELCAPLPWARQGLRETILEQMFHNDPRGRYRESPKTETARVHISARGGDYIVHGSGWYAFVGRGRSPLPQGSDEDHNPIGPAFAAVAAAAELAAHRLRPQSRGHVFNCMDWTEGLSTEDMPPLPVTPGLGNLWTVGAGSVGTSILYFLVMATREFKMTIFDMDEVKRHNIIRSPIFGESDRSENKAQVAERFLRSTGATNVTVHAVALDEAGVWGSRPQGCPDILIPTANERNVRSLIEGLYPPIQVYGTTGRSWQMASIQHVPWDGGCSCCLFPESVNESTLCATDYSASGPSGTSDEDTAIDAALPFLSFGAGLMAVADMLKLEIQGYRGRTRRAFFYTNPELRLRGGFPVERREACVCQGRTRALHEKINAGSKYFV